jgi:MFS family permease
LLFGLAVGVWVDRLRRRPVMVASDLGRALLIGLVPVAALAGALRMELLYGIAFAAGILTVFFDVALTSYSPTLVPRGQLVESNAALAVGRSTANVVGPGAAGGLVALVGAPYAVALDALSYLASALLVAGIGAPEPAPGSPAGRRAGFRREVGEGLRAVWDDEVLRPLTLGTAAGSLGGAVQGAVYVLFAVDELRIGAVALGLVLAASGAAAVVGGVVAGPTAARLGAGPAMIWGQVVVTVGIAVPLAAGRGPELDAPVLAVGQALVGLGLTVWSVHQISLRQAITAPHLLGRVNATRRFLVFGIQPIGALLGGVLGGLVGLRAAMAVAGAIEVAAVVVFLRSPLRTLRNA